MFVCFVSCSYLSAIGDVDIELSISTKSLDVNCFFSVKLFEIYDLKYKFMSTLNIFGEVIDFL